ncbi:hypothetical protein BO85DRAFT_452362, partial [Aspergillus piperis CBS 112811]
MALLCQMQSRWIEKNGSADLVFNYRGIPMIVGFGNGCAASVFVFLTVSELHETQGRAAYCSGAIISIQQIVLMMGFSKYFEGICSTMSPCL